MSVKALFASHAEIAIHAAAFLAGYAQSGAVVVGYHHAFHGLSVAHVEEIFCGAVDATLLLHRSLKPQREALLQPGAVSLGDVVHLVETRCPMHINPLSQLLGCETWHAKACHNVLQARERHAHKRHFCLIVCCFFHIPQKYKKKFI